MKAVSRPWLALFLLWLAALGLALHGLGNVPLRDWDEAIVARVSLEISRGSWQDVLLPTYLGKSYLNKPPGMHLAIAALIRLWRLASGAGPEALPPEWVVRLIPALGSTLLVPLLALVQTRLRPGRWEAALATALITLTLMPLARHGRLAMLDGTQLSAMALVWLGVLVTGGRRRRTVAGGLLAGLGGSALLLMKAPVALPVVLGALALRWLDCALDRRRWLWLIGGLLLGLVPGIAWHLGNGIARGEEALVMWGPQGMARITTAVENNGGGPVVPLVQLLMGGWPWLPLWPFGIALAWRERRNQAGRWTLGLTLLSALLVFPLRTQLPWYSLLLWPPFALACGPVLGSLVLRGGGPALTGWLRWIWLSLGGLLLGAVALSFTPIGAGLAGLRMLGVPAALGLLSAGLLLTGRAGPGRRLQAVLALGGGWALSLLVLFGSPLWNWELNEQPSILPAIALAGVTDTSGRRLPLVLPPDDGDGHRPSFRWYLDPSTDPSEETGGSRSDGPFLVISRTDRPDLPPPAFCRVDAVGEQGWKRWLCSGR